MLGSSLWGTPPQKVADDFYEFQNAWGKNEFLSIAQRVEDSVKGSTLEWKEREDLANTILEKIKNQQPASFIRLSDGEGNILGVNHSYGIGHSLIEWCMKRISYIHFGDYNTISQDPASFSADLVAALNNADAIGYAEFKSVINSFTVPDENKDVRAISGNRISLLYLNDHINSTRHTIASSAWFSRQLLPFYERIIKSAPETYLITSYPQLPDVIAEGFGINRQRISLIQVPTQAVFIDTNKRADTKHFPEAMHRIVNEIKDKSNSYKVVLVAAGLLGKHYCNVVKNSGGLAIDIGSIAEVWLGINARGMDRTFIERWRLS